MKNISGILAVMMAFFFAGCKKDTSVKTVTAFCKNTCYICYQTSNYHNSATVCPDTTTDEGRQNWQDLNLIYTCKESPPSVYYQFTGAEQQVADSIASEKGKGLNCYYQGTYTPHYFDYTAFVEQSDRCNACYDTIALRYAEFFFDTVDALTGFCTDCISQDFVTYVIPGLVQYASERVDGMNCGTASSIKFSINGYIGSTIRKRVFLPYCPTCPITNTDHDQYVKLNGWIDFNPQIEAGLNAAIFRECH